MSLVLAIPMAGRGARFEQAGWHIPKYMIKAGGATLFEHSLSSLPLDLFDLSVFIILKEHEQFGAVNFIESGLKALNATGRHEIITLDQPTRGQSETVLASCAPFVKETDEIGIYNIDTYFRSSSLRVALSGPDAKKDGVIGAFKLEREDNKWSFALEKNGKVVRTAEKEQISHNALTGFYHFTRAGDFFDAARNAIRFDRRDKGEFYVAPLYNNLIEKGRHFVLNLVDKFVALGTPLEVEEAVRSGSID